MFFLQNLSRWLLLLALVEAPWAYGSTRPWTEQLLNELLLISFLLYLPAFVFSRERRFSLPWFPAVCFALLLTQTLWMWYNARSFLDSAFWEFVPLLQPNPDLPGSWDRAATEFQLESLTALFSAFLVAAGMVNDPRWRDRLWLAIAATGISIVFYGIFQRAFVAPSIFWLQEDTGRTFFGSFRYHGNAGAFLNLIWPVIVFLLIRSFRRHGAYSRRAAWSSFLFVVLSGCFINISRAAAAITVFLALITYLWFFPHAHARPTRHRLLKALILLALFGLFVAAIVVVGERTASARHWDQFSYQFSENNQRLLAYGACMRIIPEAGWFGFGPGSFSSIFPFHTLYLGNRIYGFWKFAHEDYLQTVIEYGYAGATVWSLFFFGGIINAWVRSLISLGGVTDRLGYAACVIALMGVALHSLVDFPLQVPSIRLYVIIFIALAWRLPGPPAKTV